MDNQKPRKIETAWREWWRSHPATSLCWDKSRTFLFLSSTKPKPRKSSFRNLLRYTEDTSSWEIWTEYSRRTTQLTCASTLTNGNTTRGRWLSWARTRRESFCYTTMPSSEKTSSTFLSRHLSIFSPFFPQKPPPGAWILSPSATLCWTPSVFTPPKYTVLPVSASRSSWLEKDWRTSGRQGPKYAWWLIWWARTNLVT